jgi:hypothetical protein
MTTPNGRGNGLPEAARYVALVDVDPPLADHVLELLRDAGVTAVAEPLAGDQGPARDTPPPQRPTERVHVDQGRLQLARTVVGQALPALRADFLADVARRADQDASDQLLRRRTDLPADEVDSLFADIVAGFDTPAADPVPRWSILEDAPDAASTDRSSADRPSTDAADPPRPPLSSRLLRSGPDSPAPVEDTEDHFVPPEPPPLPEADRVTRLAWAALLGGPALIVLATLLQIPLDGWVLVLALGAFIGGFGTLVARMHDRPRQDDGWDDGAVL